MRLTTIGGAETARTLAGRGREATEWWRNGSVHDSPAYATTRQHPDFEKLVQLTYIFDLR